MINPKKIIAQAIVSCGYGTSYYDSEIDDCILEAYAGVERVLINRGYWDKYEKYMSVPLYNDFNLRWGFDWWKITVYKDGSFDVKEYDQRAKV